MGWVVVGGLEKERLGKPGRFFLDIRARQQAVAFALSLTVVVSSPRRLVCLPDGSGATAYATLTYVGVKAFLPSVPRSLKAQNQFLCIPKEKAILCRLSGRLNFQTMNLVL